MTKVVDFVLSVDTFEQQCVVLKGMLPSPYLKYHMNTIGVDQSFSNSALLKHGCLQNINKLYKYSVNCDEQQEIKDTLEAAMFSTPEGFPDNSSRYTITPTPV